MRFWIVPLLVLPLAAQHGKYANDSKNPALGNPEAIAAGAKLYAQSCAQCHAPDGSGGRGPNLVRRTLWHPLTDDGMFKTIREGVPGSDMPPTKLSDDQTWQLVAFIHNLTGPANESNIPGDVAAGEQVFWSGKAGCSNCHSIRGRGSHMGPDLTNVGGGEPFAIIRRAIVNPEKKRAMAGKEGVVVTLNNGTVIRGIARNRSNYALQVVDRQGALHIVSMTDVKELTIREGSIMPQDYAKRLTPDEIQNLLAYLSRQSVRPAEPPSSSQEKSSQ